ncbi:MAG: 3-phosphoshikimate 1-carboxyvinyltransferase [Erysipelotrichaceae bacterium]|nr:3-phosphoshikimate 1-carboxyvinyltransferase [Erysipelotrichaceae bacterium]
MKVRIIPNPVTNTEIRIPSGKSLGHRAIIAASLAEGTSTITNLDHSSDIDATIACMRAWGAEIDCKDDAVVITGTSQGKMVNDALCCEESGSTLRFLIPVFAMSGKPVKFTGKGRLLQRPLSVYQNLFEENNLRFVQTGSSVEICGPLQGKTYVVDGNVSSQFITGLLLALPLAKEDSVLRIVPPFASKSYVGLTLDVLRTFGITIEQKDELTFRIKGNQKYRPCHYAVEADDSQAAFWAVLSAYKTPLVLKGVNPLSKQADHAVFRYLEAMGATITEENAVSVTAQKMTGTEMDLEDCPDLGPVLFAAAAMAEGSCHFVHTKRLTIKESDRVEAMRQELERFGVRMDVGEDDVTVYGTAARQPEAELSGHNDHRIVMALTIYAVCNDMEVVIDGAQAVSKSYPKFFEDVKSLGIGVEVWE